MQNVYFEHDLVTVEDERFADFCAPFLEIPAGGGLVCNREGRYLLICRHGIWDLPKGKQEPDETIETCALREVEEETGLKNLVLGEKICVTHHTYEVFGEKCLKHTHWFRMYDEAEESPVPQEEEDITRVVWVEKERLPEYLEGTYPSIREVFISAGLL